MDEAHGVGITYTRTGRARIRRPNRGDWTRATVRRIRPRVQRPAVVRLPRRRPLVAARRRASRRRVVRRGGRASPRSTDGDPHEPDVVRAAKGGA
jgi:hypothetical protein